MSNPRRWILSRDTLGDCDFNPPRLEMDTTPGPWQLAGAGSKIGTPRTVRVRVISCSTTGKARPVMASNRITRRGFVGTVGATAGAAAWLGARASEARAIQRANDRIRLGLIGAGSRGNQLLSEFLKRDEFVFTAVADVDDHHAGETADRIAKAKGGDRPRTMRDYRALLDGDLVDAVVIATPDHWHAHPTIQACQAGKDVYVEKPLAHNVAEGQAMIRAAKKHHRLVSVGTQQRSSENFQKAVETVQSGKLGDVFWVQTWNFENISPVGMGPAEQTAPPDSRRL